MSRLASSIAIVLLALTIGCRDADDVDPPTATTRTDGAVQPQGEAKFSPWARQQHSPRVIVFVHGVLGDGLSTWTNVATGQSWPDIVSKDPAFDGIDIYVHQFPSRPAGSTLDIDELTEDLRRKLEAFEVLSGYEQVIFVAHSMGGLVVRGYLTKYREVSEQVPMIFFLSTPTTGSALASFAKAFSRNPQFGDMIGIADNTYLGSQQSSWLASGLGAKIKSYCAYETRDTYGFRIVTRESATNLCTEHLDPIDTNHIDIAKPADISSDQHLALRIALNQTLRGGAQREVEINQQTLDSLLPDLRSKVRSQSYLVKAPVRLAGVTASRELWYVDNLRFEPEGQFLLGNTDLEIRVRGKLEGAIDGQALFLSYPEGERVAKAGDDGGGGGTGAGTNQTDGGGNGLAGGGGGSGLAGATGKDGNAAGNLTLELRTVPPRPLRISLVGQSGGKGGNGGNGGAGGVGATGAPGVSNLFDCGRGGGNGGPGGPGGGGGNAGLGGNCGPSGRLVLKAPPEISASIVAAVVLDSARATVGPTGNPGSGGTGGGGGGGGSGSGHCGGGSPGGTGANGSNGSVPQDPRPKECEAAPLESVAF